MTLSTLTISLAQIDIVLGQPQANLSRVQPLIAEAAGRGSDIVVLPELWTTGYCLEQAESLAEEVPQGATARTLAAWAQRYQVWITGSFLIRTPAGVINGAPWFAPTGDVLSPYAKIHRFGPMAEDVWLAAGEQPGLAELPWGLTGIAICYDLRFPELFRVYAGAGARLVVLPSEWPYPRVSHWQVLLRARAIENQMFVAAVNRVGEDRANRFCGRSALIDPGGEVLVEGEEQEVLLTATIDLAQADAMRAHIPILRDRRPHCYRWPPPAAHRD